MELIGFISHETLSKLRDPDWQKQRGDVPNPAVVYTVNEPPSRCVIPVYIERPQFVGDQRELPKPLDLRLSRPSILSRFFKWIRR
jgi:hypothetical protein